MLKGVKCLHYPINVICCAFCDKMRKLRQILILFWSLSCLWHCSINTPQHQEYIFFIFIMRVMGRQPSKSSEKQVHCILSQFTYQSHKDKLIYVWIKVVNPQNLIFGLFQFKFLICAYDPLSKFLKSQRSVCAEGSDDYYFSELIIFKSLLLKCQ